MNGRISPPLTWHICQIIVDFLVSPCIVNESKGHWLLNYAIFMNLKFKDEIDSITFENLMEEDGNVIYELSCWALNIKKVVQVLDLFLLKNI